jgi:hypothetical protein
MAPEIVTLIAALSGAIVGGLINLLSSRSTKTHEWKLTLLRDKASMRQRLYSELLVQCESHRVSRRPVGLSQTDMV